MFPGELRDKAAAALAAARAAGLRIATAETVTAGLVSACLTSVAGASSIFERGFVLYHDSAKATGLGVPAEVSLRHGAVSAEVTLALVNGALRESGAGVAVGVTGYAGPGGGNERDPVGTVYVAAARRGGAVRAARHVFAGDRDAVRLAAVGAALDALVSALR
jgi:nicotinamide-nucleotide amidase